MSIFNRLFKVGQAEAHAALDKFENPIKMTEQGIRDLKKDLQNAMTSLAEVKAIALRTRREAENHKKRVADYERKAMMLLQKMQNGELDQAEAERLATEALNAKEQASQEAIKTAQEADRHEQMASQLQVNVNKIKSTITTYENDLVTLKARAKTATATKKINQQIASMDSSGTIAMLEKMKQKVEEDESLAEAYGEMAAIDRSVDDEINVALESGGKPVTPSVHLLELKEKMGIS
ncbi:MAG: PspA/IM30 family protein [Deltaproteobacteria bacterium]|nr:PspA/IM30 family protein [Deltaproteobacteria bacterium]MBW2052680.1 PspA/IM30 family protein [Deltaproteobacteria bacterium]MBW2141839.1 PspA/IM30 family protein [Deltaproteobacteria bacterium]MBW2323626.1 PspA/IM30 family protein [Deltaproteobacteria bacterium]